MNATQLLTHFDRIADAPDAIPRLRRFILDLAVRGKLVEQDPNDEPASELLKRIAAEKERLVEAGEVKKQSALPLVAACEAPFSIPNVWEWTRIGSAAHVEMGQSPPSEHYNRTGHGIPFFQGKADFGKRYPTARYWCTQPKKYAIPGDILISVRAPVGPTNIASELCCIGRGLAALRPYKGIDRDYLLRCLETFELVLAALGFGTTFVAINKNQLASFVIPLPPLAEQHRIVAKVDELMALCDRLETAQKEREATRDRLAAVSLARLNAPDPDPTVFQNHVAFALDNLVSLAARPDQIKALRQTVLNLAVRGKLVEQDPKEDDRNQRKLRSDAAAETYDVGAFEGRVSLFERPLDWAIEPLSRVASHIVDCLHTTPKWTEEGVLCIKTNQVRAGQLDLSSPHFVNENTYKARVSRLEPRQGDILYIREGGVLGVACLVPSNTRLCLGQRLMQIRASDAIVPQFLELCLNSPWITEFAAERTTGGAAPRVNMSIVRSYPIPLPPLAEQHRIVAKVDELMSLCDRLEASLTTGDETRGQLVEAMLQETLASEQGCQVTLR